MVTDSQSSKPTRKFGQKLKNWVITSFNTANFKKWKSLEDVRVRYLVYQMEVTPTTNKLHIQAYIELYEQVRLTKLKEILGDSQLHAEKRKGTREMARDYCKKDEGAYFQAKYPQWNDKGGRISGTDVVEVGLWNKRPGERTDLLKVKDLIAAGASELDILEECPRQYLKYSGHIQKARALYARRTMNRYADIKVKVLWGQAGAGKTRQVFDTHGPENVFTPIWNGQKWWFDGYTGQKVLLINEFYGQCRTSVMQQLLDKYRMQVEFKGGTTVSAWDTIYVTTQRIGTIHGKTYLKRWNSHSSDGLMKFTS